MTFEHVSVMEQARLWDAQPGPARPSPGELVGLETRAEGIPAQSMRLLEALERVAAAT